MQMKRFECHLRQIDVRITFPDSADVARIILLQPITDKSHIKQNSNKRLHLLHPFDPQLKASPQRVSVENPFVPEARFSISWSYAPGPPFICKYIHCSFHGLLFRRLKLPLFINTQ